MKLKFRQWNCVLQTAQYGNGRTALQLVDAEDGEPVATATVNLPDETLGENEVFIKDYAENEGMLKTLQDAGIVEPTGKVVASGFVAIPVCRLTGAYDHGQ